MGSPWLYRRRLSAGAEPTEADLQQDVDRRRTRTSHSSASARADQVRILRGVYGRTTGT
jgi:chorismate synthase